MKWFATLKSELNKITFYRSLKFRISLLIVLTGLISCSVMRFGILQSYFNRAVEVRVGDVQNQMKVLADHLLTYNYLQEFEYRRQLTSHQWSSNIRLHLS